MKLPIDDLRLDFETALERGPVVLASPTGSGKSTQVPRWCGGRGRVLVVEPRRVACRALASRVAELEGVELGRAVGYSVRDEHRAAADTRILFATPGVVLRWLGDGREQSFNTVVLDEFHERRLDVDLLLALLADRRRLVVMSATMDVMRVAEHLGGTPLEGGARRFPVQQEYVPGATLLPAVRGLEQRLAEAVRLASQDPGHILVFLPGVGEIRAAAERLGRNHDFEILPLHGSLSLAEQSRVFSATEGRRLILATNVAETSLTVPGVGVVIDSGLVRRTRYAAGRGFLSLVPVASDSAEQRAGRAGRTAPGVCYRLWSESAILEERTPPEVLRESLVPLVLAAAACGRRPHELPLLDSPRAHAVDVAVEELDALGALDGEGRITPRGRRLFGLPLDPWLGRLLVAAEETGALDDAVDLAAALETGRRLFRGSRPELQEDDLRATGCDAVALIRAVREGDPERHGLDRQALLEARQGSRRLRRVFDLAPLAETGRIDREGLARTVLAADPRAAHVARRRRGRVAWSNGGTELELARDSAVDGDKVEAIAVLGTHAVARDARTTLVVATSAMPLELSWLAESGLGRETVARVAVERGAAVAVIERVHAGRVIASREDEPAGELARQAIAELILRGTALKGAAATLRQRLADVRLLHRLRASGLVAGVAGAAPPEDEEWLIERLAELGVERGSDLALLSREDVQPASLEAQDQALLERQFPRSLELADAHYRVEYDLRRSEVILHRVRGAKKLPPPSLAFLPRFQGFRILFKHHSKVHVLRERG